MFDGLATGTIVRQQPEADYHARVDHVSATALKAGLSKRHPAAVWEALHYGTSIHPTAALVGSAVHCALLEPDAFDSQYVHVEAADRRRKEWKQGAADAEDAGLVPVITSDYDTIMRCVEATRQHTEASSVLDSLTDTELSCYAVDDSGVKVRARFDGYGAGALVDVKTTSGGVDRTSFGKAAASYGYDLQAAHYMHVARLCGLDVQAFRFVVIGKGDPARVAVYHLSAEDLEGGEMAREMVTADYAKWLRRTEGLDRAKLLAAEGYGGGVIHLPTWRRRQIEAYQEMR